MTLATTAKTLAKITNRLKGSLGATIDDLWALREEKRAAEEGVKIIEAKMSALEEDLMEKLKQQGTKSATGAKATASIITAVVANVDDWAAFHAFIAKNKFFHLLHKRVSEPAYRELLDAGKKVPGVQPFSKEKINLRATTP